MSPRFVRLAGVFYGSLVVVAVLWNTLRGRETEFLGDSILASLALGVLTAVGTLTLGLLAYRLLPALRSLSDELGPRLVDGTDYGSLVLISVFSGVGEEALFRGAVQEEFGLVPAAIIFGLLHVGPNRRYLAWTAWAVLAGFVFGYLYALTGGLLAPMVAHSLHNAATFVIWKRSRSAKAG
ncbi:MAG: CPBP family intramembrane glutamic endopeptidase [Actinomycetota bacterium]